MSEENEKEMEKNNKNEREENIFRPDLHLKYFSKHLKTLRPEYQQLDPNRMTLLYFVISALDILDSNIDINTRNSIIDWVYAQQIFSSSKNNEESKGSAGFRSGSQIGMPFSRQNDENVSRHKYDNGHLAMTYTALCILKITGDDYQRLNRKAIIKSLKSLQLKDGSFVSTIEGSENDLRFVYCACAISALLNDQTGFDIELTVQYILSCQTYDGAFGLRKHGEGHGGSTYCAVASLALLNRLDSILDRQALIRQCINRQGKNGYSGRPGKPSDSCYSFQIGSVLQILDCNDLIEEFDSDKDPNLQFNLSCQNLDMGGFAKYPYTFPDILHSYMALCGVSLMQNRLKKVCSYRDDKETEIKRLKIIDPIIGVSLQTLNNLGGYTQNAY